MRGEEEREEDEGGAEEGEEGAEGGVGREGDGGWMGGIAPLGGELGASLAWETGERTRRMQEGEHGEYQLSSPSRRYAASSPELHSKRHEPLAHSSCQPSTTRSSPRVGEGYFLCYCAVGRGSSAVGIWGRGTGARGRWSVEGRERGVGAVLGGHSCFMRRGRAEPWERRWA